MPVAISTPNVVTEIEGEDLDALLEELRKIADGAPRLAAAHELIGKLERLDQARGLQVFEPDDKERFALLRAASNLRAFGASGPLVELYSRMHGTGGVKPRSYRLRFLDGRPQKDFVSYSLEYEPGDRVVTFAAEEFRVVGLETIDNVDELTVDDWQPKD